MYAKKNVYDNINWTLLNRQYKIKDSVNARLDLVVIGIHARNEEILVRQTVCKTI